MLIYSRSICCHNGPFFVIVLGVALAQCLGASAKSDLSNDLVTYSGTVSLDRAGVLDETLQAKSEVATMFAEFAGLVADVAQGSEVDSHPSEKQSLLQIAHQSCEIAVQVGESHHDTERRLLVCNVQAHAKKLLEPGPYAEVQKLVKELDDKRIQDVQRLFKSLGEHAEGSKLKTEAYGGTLGKLVMGWKTWKTAADNIKVGIGGQQKVADEEKVQMDTAKKAKAKAITDIAADDKKIKEIEQDITKLGAEKIAAAANEKSQDKSEIAKVKSQDKSEAAKENSRDKSEASKENSQDKSEASEVISKAKSEVAQESQAKSGIEEEEDQAKSEVAGVKSQAKSGAAEEKDQGKPEAEVKPQDEAS